MGDESILEAVGDGSRKVMSPKTTSFMVGSQLQPYQNEAHVTDSTGRKICRRRFKIVQQNNENLIVMLLVLGRYCH